MPERRVHGTRDKLSLLEPGIAFRSANSSGFRRPVARRAQSSVLGLCDQRTSLVLLAIRDEDLTGSNPDTVIGKTAFDFRQDDCTVRVSIASAFPQK